MVALSDRPYSATSGVPGGTAISTPGFTTTEELREKFRHAMCFDSASPEAQAYWETIEATLTNRPDLLQRLVEACTRDNIRLEQLYTAAATSQALTMNLVVASAQVPGPLDAHMLAA